MLASAKHTSDSHRCTEADKKSRLRSKTERERGGALSVPPLHAMLATNKRTNNINKNLCDYACGERRKESTQFAFLSSALAPERSTSRKLAHNSDTAVCEATERRGEPLSEQGGWGRRGGGGVQNDTSTFVMHLWRGAGGGGLFFC